MKFRFSNIIKIKHLLLNFMHKIFVFGINKLHLNHTVANVAMHTRALD